MAEARQFTPAGGTAPWLQRMANWLSAFAREWSAFPLSGGALVSVTFANGTVTVAHGLGHLPRGFVVLQPQHSTYPYAATWSDRTDRHIVLTAGAAFTSDVWFF